MHGIMRITFSVLRDEGARQWRKREAEWEREQLARERLMKSVTLFFNTFPNIELIIFCL